MRRDDVSTAGPLRHMTTVGSVTPEWDPPYQPTTIRGVRYKLVFDGRVPPEHIWAGRHGGPQRAGFGRLERAVVDSTSVAVFRDGEFVLPVRLVLGGRPAVSLRDLIGLIARDADVERNTDVIRETRDMVEHMLELHPDTETDTLLPLVPLVNLRRVLRVLVGIIPTEIERFRRSADWRWLIEQLGSDLELAAALGQPWATADAAFEPSFIETESSLDELLVGPEEEDTGLTTRWQYCPSAKTLGGRKQYTGRGAGCAPRPADHYGAMIRSYSDYYITADQLKQAPPADWAYTATAQTLSPRDKMTNFALDHTGKHEQMTIRGKRSATEQISTTEMGRVPVWRRPPLNGGRTARARLEGRARAEQAAVALDDALAQTWKSSSKNESWPNNDTSLRAKTAEVANREAHQMPHGCGVHPAPPASPKGGGRALVVGQDIPEWAETLRDSHVSSLRKHRVSPSKTEGMTKHASPWRYSNKGAWGKHGMQLLDTTMPYTSEHDVASCDARPTKEIGQGNIAPQAAWRYAMQSKELSSETPSAHTRGHPDSDAATQGDSAIPSEPDTDPEDLERVGQLWRLRAAVPPGRLWVPSKQGTALDSAPKSIHEATPSGGGTAASAQEFRAHLPGPSALSQSWRLSSTQRTLDCDKLRLRLADTAMSPRGGHDTAHENLVAYLAARSPPNKRPLTISPAPLPPSSGSSMAAQSHNKRWYADKLHTNTKMSIGKQLQSEQPEEHLGWSYSSREEKTLPPEQRLWGNTVKSVHAPREAYRRIDDPPSWSRGRGTNVSSLW